MKKTTTLFMKITLALFLVFSTSNILKAQENVNIIELQDLIGEDLSVNVYPTDMIEFQGKLYIGMADSQGSYDATETELIRFDGTTAEIVDLGNYEVGSFAYFCIYDNDLYFRLFNGQLGKYDGTTCTEINLTQLDPLHVQDPAMPGHLCAYNGELFFKIGGIQQLPDREDEFGEPLAKYNASSNTLTVFDMNAINPNMEWDCEPNSLVVYDNLLFFASENNDWNGGYDLTSFDGNNTPNLIPFADPDFMMGWKGYLCVFNNNLYMRTEESGGLRAGYSTLGKYDGINPVSIVDLNTLNPQIAQSNYPGGMSLHNNMMYFKTEDLVGNRVLASYNGTNAIIHDLSLLDPSIAYDLKPSAITSYQGNLYFRGETADRAGTQLIQYDNSESIPINNWGILFGVLLITSLIVIRLFKK